MRAASRSATSATTTSKAPRRPPRSSKKFHLPEGYEIELVVQESEGLGKFVSVYFDQRGRMWTQTALEYPVDSNENPAAAEAVYAGKGKDKVLVYPRESLNAKIPAGGLTNPPSSPTASPSRSASCPGAMATPATSSTATI
jgi:hypothetical protein